MPSRIAAPIKPGGVMRDIDTSVGMANATMTTGMATDTMRYTTNRSATRWRDIRGSIPGSGGLLLLMTGSQFGVDSLVILPQSADILGIFLADSLVVVVP